VLETPAEATRPRRIDAKHVSALLWDGRPRFYGGETNLNKHACRGICSFRSSHPKSEAISLELEGNRGSYRAASPPPNCSRTSTQRILQSSRQYTGCPFPYNDTVSDCGTLIHRQLGSLFLRGGGSPQVNADPHDQTKTATQLIKFLPLSSPEHQYTCAAGILSSNSYR
jgi:hypothetical protein